MIIIKDHVTIANCAGATPRAKRGLSATYVQRFRFLFTRRNFQHRGVVSSRESVRARGHPADVHTAFVYGRVTYIGISKCAGRCAHTEHSIMRARVRVAARRGPSTPVRAQT